MNINTKAKIIFILISKDDKHKIINAIIKTITILTCKYICLMVLIHGTIINNKDTKNINIVFLTDKLNFIFKNIDII